MQVIEPSGRKRRNHSPEFKAKAVEACRQAGVSVAATAMAHGINANLLRRWVIAQDAARSTPSIEQSPSLATAEFIPLQLSAPVAPASDIRIEMRRGATAVTVIWPAQEASTCAAWLREWLK